MQWPLNPPPSSLQLCPHLLCALFIIVAAIVIIALTLHEVKTGRPYLQTLRAVIPAAVGGAGRSLVVAEAQSVEAQHTAHTVAH